MGNFIERLDDEILELDEKISKLSTFLSSDKFNELDQVHQKLLQIQLDAMNTYFAVLDSRIMLLKDNKPTKNYGEYFEDYLKKFENN